MSTVFISHSSEDAAFIEQEILPILKSRSIRVWYSGESIRSAEEWERAIKGGLEGSDWVLVAVSPHSARSKWVRAELGWAFANREGRIVPIMIDTCDPFELHIRLNDVQFIDFRRDRRKAADRLLAAFAAGKAGPASAPRASAASGFSDTAPLKALAHSLMSKGDLDAALVELDAALEMAPGDAGAWVLRGACHASKSSWDAAIADFTRGLSGELIPLGRSMTYIQRGRAYAATDNDRLALADLTEALACDPNNTDAHVLRGKLRRRTLDREGAITDFAEALRLKPSAEAYFQRAQVSGELGRTQQAAEDYEAAVGLEPTIAERIPTHLRKGASPGIDVERIEDARRSLRALGFLAGQMDTATPEAKSRGLRELMAIGFPKAIADVDYLIQNLPKGTDEQRAAVLLAEIAKKAGIGSQR